MKHNHVKGLEPNDTIIKGDLDGKSYKIKQTDTIQNTILKEKMVDFNF